MWRAREDRLFARYRRGRDPRLLARVFDRTAEPLWRIARHVAGRSADADDLVQQTFLVAIERADSWDEARGLFPWLVGILSNQARLARRAARREVDPTRLREGVWEDPAAALQDKELEQAIAAAVADLGDAYRPVLHLHLFHGLNAQEIGAALDRPAGTVRTQLVRGLERLRRALPVGLGVTAFAVTATPARALATIRRQLLATHAPPLAAGAAAATSLLALGGTMKKWLLLVPAALLLALGVWQGLRLASTAADAPATAAPERASGGIVADAETPPASIEPAAPHDQVELAERRSSDVRGSLLVRCSALVDDRRVPAAGAWIAVRRDGPAAAGEPGLRDAPPNLDGRADDRGELRLEELPPGAWRVLAHLGLGQGKGQATVVPGQETEVQLDITGLRTVGVRVVDERDTPVPDAELRVGIHMVGRIRPVQILCRTAARTDAEGRAQVLADGIATVSARKPGYADSHACRTNRVSGEIVTLVLRDGPGEIEGLVVDELGAPVPDAAIVVQSTGYVDPTNEERTADGRQTIAPVPWVLHSDDAGRFVLPGVAPGEYRCFADRSLRGGEEVAVVVEAHLRAPVRIVVPRTVQLRGTALHADGSPATGARVQVRTPAGQPMSWAWSVDTKGNFSLDVPRCELLVEVSRNGAVFAEARLVPEPDMAPLRFTVDEPLSLAGRLVDEQGAPVAGWYVAAVASADPDQRKWYEALGEQGYLRTTADGSFSLWGLGDGPFTVVAHASHGGWREGRGPVMTQGVRAGTTDLVLTVPASALPRAVLSGSVVDSAGAPLAGATVSLLRDGSYETTNCVDGRFHISRLTPGSHTLHVRAPGRAARTVDVDLRDAETELPPIALPAAVPLRVRPLLPDAAPFRGPLPHPRIRHADGTAVSPYPSIRAADGSLTIDGLPPGRYLLAPPSHDDITADELPFELHPNLPLDLDWPVRIGR